MLAAVSSASGQSALFGFDSAFLHQLERLALLSHRPLSGPAAGPRRSPRHGVSVEFADFRDYAPGDDFRRIDWNAFARLDRLFLRLYSAEEMSTLTLFLDHSASMGFGEPRKGLTAARLAAVFAYVALHNYDRVAVAGWGDAIDSFLPVQMGKGAIPRVWQFIADVMESPSAATDASSLRQYGRYSRARGLAVVLSDLLSDSDWRSGLQSLRASGQEVTVIQILAREELTPDLRGDWKLRDVENGREVEITVSSRLLKRYEQELAAHTDDIRGFCMRQGIDYIQIPSDAPIADIVLSSLRVAGVLA